MAGCVWLFAAAIKTTFPGNIPGLLIGCSLLHLWQLIFLSFGCQWIQYHFINFTLLKIVIKQQESQYLWRSVQHLVPGLICNFNKQTSKKQTMKLNLQFHLMISPKRKVYPRENKWFLTQLLLLIGCVKKALQKKKDLCWLSLASWDTYCSFESRRKCFLWWDYMFYVDHLCIFCWCCRDFISFNYQTLVVCFSGRLLSRLAWAQDIIILPSSSKSKALFHC